MTIPDASRTQAGPSTKQHFPALDGLRGVAAIAVVVFHFMEMVNGDYSQIFIGHGWLAVDFFFCLSGFVIGYAYDDRIGSMGVWGFFKIRLIRLHPMVVFGSLLGLVTLCANPLRVDQLPYDPGSLALLLLTSIFLIPYPTMPEAGFSLFGLNSPAWSLFSEYMANVAYALVLCRLGRRSLSMATAAAAIVLCVVGYREGNLWGGFNGDTFWVGAARVTFSFLAGLLVYRRKWLLRTRLGFPVLALLLILPLVMPYADRGWIREVVVIVLYFPLIVMLGAGSLLGRPAVRFCKIAGEISYPLYMTHYSVMYIFGDYYRSTKPDTWALTLVIGGSVAGLIAFAYLVMRYVDLPLRRYLMNRGQ